MKNFCAKGECEKRELQAIVAEYMKEVDRLRKRIYWAESSLDTWDEEKDASYWDRYPERMVSPFHRDNQQVR